MCDAKHLKLKSWSAPNPYVVEARRSNALICVCVFVGLIGMFLTSMRASLWHLFLSLSFSLSLFLSLFLSPLCGPLPGRFRPEKVYTPSSSPLAKCPNRAVSQTDRQTEPTHTHTHTHTISLDCALNPPENHATAGHQPYQTQIRSRRSGQAGHQARSKPRKNETED